MYYYRLLLYTLVHVWWRVGRAPLLDPAREIYTSVAGRLKCAPFPSSAERLVRRYCDKARASFRVPPPADSDDGGGRAGGGEEPVPNDFLSLKSPVRGALIGP